jgi:hypothetical protein
MNDKMKDCFSPHTMMHGLFGLGLGLLLAILIPSLQLVWLAVVIMVIAFVADYMRRG